MGTASEGSLRNMWPGALGLSAVTVGAAEALGVVAAITCEQRAALGCWG